MDNVPRVDLENFMKVCQIYILFFFSDEKHHHHRSHGVYYYSFRYLSQFTFTQDPTSEKALADCKAVVDSFYRTSALVVKDPRVSIADNDEFLELMEQYFNQSTEAKLKDVRPQFHFQVGATPELTELPRDHTETIGTMPEDKKPLPVEGKDPKWRFFWRAGERPPSTQYEELNMPQVIPEAFPQWENVMNRWSGLMLGAVHVVAEMLAVGLGLEKTTFTDRMKYAPHLLAPTGSDLEKYGKLNTVLAGFHTDLYVGMERIDCLTWGRTRRLQIFYPLYFSAGTS